MNLQILVDTMAVHTVQKSWAETADTVNSFWANAKDFFLNSILGNVPKFILAILILWIGWKLISKLNGLLKKLMIKRDTDVSLQDFIGRLIDILLKVVLLLTVMGMVGIQVTSFVALLGSIGLAIGMALQGTLQNFAGGVIVLLLKPYRVGDFIEQGSFSGVVNSIQIFNTILTTADNKVIVIPNSQLATGSLINYTKSDIRRVDVPVGIAYGESVEKARQILLDLVKDYPVVLNQPELPVVYVVSLGESSVNLQLRVWVKTNDYWPTQFALNQAVYDTFQKQGINIPFNQLDVHLTK